MRRNISAIAVFLLLAGSAHAGLYYSDEPLAELPSQWRGFLLDQRTLRNIAVKPAENAPANTYREKYLQAAARLEKTTKERKLTADELADLGAVYVRLGEITKAIDLLRNAQRDHPNHFRIAANLGTAWQVQGDLNQAAANLQEAVRLAPGKLQKAEELHLKLVRQRQREAKDAQDLDDLFGVRYGGKDGKYEAGVMTAEERKKLPANAVGLVQQLALWLPADGRLLWQLAELANAFGDVRTAAAIMDGCVTEFALASRTLRDHRKVTRAAADELAKNEKTAKADHEEHGLAFKSKRPLLSRLDLANLPPIRDDAVNDMPWAVIYETSVDRQARPAFPKYLKELDGKQISLTGFMQPLGDDLEVSSFMFIEYPVGCWFCEMPEITGILFVELPSGKSVNYTRSLVKIVGTLKLNADDPENFLYIVSKAKVAQAD